MSLLLASLMIITILFNPIPTNIIEKDILHYTRQKKISIIYSHIPMDLDHLIYVIDISYKYKIDPDLVLSLIWTESNFNKDAQNAKSSAKGYGQFIKSTAESIAKKIGIENYIHNIDAFDPYINIEMICYYLAKHLSKNNNDINVALKRYRGVNDQAYLKLIAMRRQLIKQQKNLQL